MRTKKLLCLSVFLFLLGCTQERRNDSDLIHINLRGTFPEREIRLDEIADIEFLQLETHDDFLFRGSPRVITSEKIIFANFITSDVIVFSRDGSPISRFNRQGGGPEEFPQFRGFAFDEATNEIFIGSVDRIMVYSLAGEFIRRLPLPERTSLRTSYDSESLLLYNRNIFYPSVKSRAVLFTIVSKKDGSIVSTINMPPVEQIVDLSVPVRIPGTDNFTSIGYHPYNRFNDGFLLNIHASDTVFLHRNGKMMPFLVRTPSLRSTTPILLRSYLEAANFQLFTIERFNIQRLEPTIFLMRDKRTGSIYRQRITFDDFRGQNVGIHSGLVKCSGIGLISLDLVALQDANDEGLLSGRLQEIVENSYEFGNNVFMLLHFK